MKFYVGQRVRLIAKGVDPYGMHGTEATIVAINVTGNRSTGPYVGHEIDIANPFTNRGWIVRPDNLEPIDDSRELTTWSQCVWKPKELTRA